ncbi:MAG: hemolysin family protein [Chloroflexota bacterium]
MPQETATQGITIQLVVIFILILLNAFFAAAEIAIVSVRRSRLRQLAEEERDSRAAAVLRLLDQPSRFLATIQVGVTLAGFFTSAVGAVSLAVVVGAWLATVPIPVISANAYGLAFVLVTATLSFLNLVLGELAPKNLAIVQAESLALQLARPIELLSRVAAPLVWLLSAATTLVMRLAGNPQQAQVRPMTQEEIMAIVASGEEEGVVEPEERKLIDEVFEFGDTLAAEVMVPRVDVRALPKEATLAEARQSVVETGHTRLPVFDGSLDNIIGVIHAKDVLQELPPQATPEQTKRPVTSIMRRAYHVPSSKRVAELLPELQRQQLHLAVVVDEYGGTAGIVTLDNLLEEIVGPIRDEYDAREEPEIQIVSEGEAVVSGGADLEDVSGALDLNLETEGVDTIGGLVYARLGRIPSEGDMVELPDAVMEVISMRGRRVWKARVIRREVPLEEQEAGL